MQTIRVSLPTYNALTDTNPDHFALFADQDNILIKEFVRGSIAVPPNSSSTIDHNLGYIPMIAAFLTFPSFGSERYVTGHDYGVLSTTTTQLVFTTTGFGATATFEYYIFYDQQV